MATLKQRNGIYCWLFLPIILLSFSFILSCNQKKKDFLMNCRTVKKSVVKTTWSDKGWTTTGNQDLITALKIKTNKISSKIQVDLDAMKSSGDIIVGGKIQLVQESGCTSTLPADAEYVDNYLQFGLLNLVANPATGTLINFNFIRFTPIQDHPPYVNYKIDVISVNEGGEETIITTAKSNPCPPPAYCPADIFKKE